MTYKQIPLSEGQGLPIALSASFVRVHTSSVAEADGFQQVTVYAYNTSTEEAKTVELKVQGVTLVVKRLPALSGEVVLVDSLHLSDGVYLTVKGENVSVRGVVETGEINL